MAVHNIPVPGGGFVQRDDTELGANLSAIFGKLANAQAFFQNQANTITATGWDALTPAQRTTIMANACKALANLAQYLNGDQATGGV